MDFILVFPELESGREIARIMYCENGSFHPFSLNELKPEAAELLRVRITSPSGLKMDDFRIRQVLDNIDRLEVNVYSRLNHVLVPKEATKLENEISERSFSIGQQVKSYSGEIRTMLEDRLSSVLAHIEMRSS